MPETADKTYYTLHRACRSWASGSLAAIIQMADRDPPGKGKNLQAFIRERRNIHHKH